MFEIGFEWWRGMSQVAIYSAVIVAALWVMSKIELPDNKQVRDGESEDVNAGL